MFLIFSNLVEFIKKCYSGLLKFTQISSNLAAVFKFFNRKRSELFQVLIFSQFLQFYTNISVLSKLIQMSLNLAALF